ncbi:MAG TPA: VWD domain-containing protein, partial [Kribbellaceae bacterium]|nr:VWD domain-containing protein [Kribbellaceae bacterium]
MLIGLRMRSFLAAGLGLGLMAGLAVAIATPSVAAAAPCTNSADYLWHKDIRCINQVYLGSRGRGLMDDVRCRVDGPGLPVGPNVPPYWPRQCGGNGLGIEAIGQARAVSYLNRKLRGFGDNEPGIIPDVQWEVEIKGKRADILYYNRSSTTFVDVIEAKQTTNNDFNQWDGQLDNRYINPLLGMGMTNVRRGIVLDQWGEYRDDFYVSDNKDQCDTDEDLIRHFKATTPEPGLLQIEEITEDRRCSDGTNQSPGDFGDAEGELDDEETDDATGIIGLKKFFSKIFGEPHIVTVDGLQYDLQSVGEFVLAESPRYDLTIQVRFVARRDNVSVLDRAAMYVNEHLVEVGGGAGRLLVDGQPVSLASGHTLALGSNTGVIRQLDTYYILWDGPSGPTFRWDGDCCHAGLWMPPTASSDLIGLLGNADGQSRNDLRLRDGTVLPANAAPNVLHGTFADSWRISDNESFFTYGAGETTATFTDVTFPSAIVTVHDLTQEQQVLASQYCESVGVPAGAAFSACMLDMALTANTSFAAMAAQQVAVPVDPRASTLDATGHLAVDFQTDPLPTNLAPSALTQDAATGRFAGSFSGSALYRFFVQELASHMSGTLAFDLLTLGDWNADPDVEQVAVLTDRANPITVKPSTLTPNRTGTLANGVPFAVYRVSVPFNHTKSQIEVTVSAAGADGLAGQGFGVDNLTLDVTILPPQSFSVALPFTASDGAPAAGAGNLETQVSHDQYQFGVTAGQAVYVDVQACPQTSYLRWSLVDPTGLAVASGRCGDGRTMALTAGSYRLIVQTEQETLGTYRVAVFEVPPVQSFAVSLPFSIANGTPAAGAGNLETKASQDEYSFAVAQDQTLYLDVRSCPATGSASLTWKLLGPAGTSVVNGACGDASAAALQAGTYRLAVTPGNEATGAYTIDVYDVPADATGAVTIGAATSTLAIPSVGQNGYWTFTGSTGQRVYFRFTGGTFGGSTNAEVTIRRPDGGTLASTASCGTSCWFDTLTLPVDGTYRVYVNPQGSAIGALTAQLYEVPANTAGTVAVGGATSTLATPSIGQNGVWSFTGVAGQRVYFQFSGGTFGSSTSAQVTLRRPDGTSLTSSSGVCGVSCSFDTLVLPVDGTYTILLDPQAAAVGSLTARLYEVPANTAGTVTVGGATSTLATPSIGQNGVWSFAGAAGQRVYFQFTGGTYGSSSVAGITIRKPDGTSLTSYPGCGVSCSFDTLVLPVDGTYTILLDPQAAAVGSLTAQILSVPPTASDNVVTIGGPTSIATTTASGQNATWSFAGVAGQRVYFQFSGGTFGSSTSAQVTLRRPDGTSQTSSNSCGVSCSFDTLVLPVDGTYTILLDPQAAAVGSLTARLYEVPANATATVTVGGATSTLATPSIGQNGVWSFTGAAGQRVYFQFTGGTYGSFTAAGITIRKPDGTSLASYPGCGVSCSFDTLVLPGDGTYTILLDPQAAAVGSLTARLYEVPASDASNQVTIGGPTSIATTTGPGQNATWSFAGAAGQRVYFQFSGGTFGSSTSAQVTLRRPDGTSQTSSNSCGVSCSFDTLVLPVDGTYTILLDP